MENTFSLWARISFVFGSPQLIDDHPRISTASSCLSRRWCHPKVWPSLISTYGGGAYPQISLSFFALHGRVQTYCEHIYGRHDNVKFNLTIYMVTAFRGLTLGMWFANILAWEIPHSKYKWSQTRSLDFSGNSYCWKVINVAHTLPPASMERKAGRGGASSWPIVNLPRAIKCKVFSWTKGANSFQILPKSEIPYNFY